MGENFEVEKKFKEKKASQLASEEEAHDDKHKETGNEEKHEKGPETKNLEDEKDEDVVVKAKRFVSPADHPVARPDFDKHDIAGMKKEKKTKQGFEVDREPKEEKVE